MPLNFDFTKMFGAPQADQQRQMWQNYQAPQMNPMPMRGGIAGGMPQLGIGPSMDAMQGMMNPQMQNQAGLNFGDLMSRNQNTGIAGPFGIGPSNKRLIGGI